MIDPALACLALAAAVASIALTGGAVAGALGFERKSAVLAARAESGRLGARVDRLLVSCALGTSAWMALLLALAALGLLDRGLIVALGLLLPALALGARVRGGRSPTASAPPPTAPRSRWTVLALVAGGASAAVVVLALVARALIPDVSWDADVYHLALPRLYLDHGGFYRVPFSVYSNWPLGLELLYAGALALRDFVVAKLLHLVFGLLAALAAWRLAGGGERGVLAALLFLAHPVVLGEMPVAYVDLGSAFFLALGFGALHRALEDGPQGPRRTLLLAGLCAGALCAIKLTGFLGAGCLGLLFLLEARAGAGWTRAARRHGLALLALPCAAFLLPWLLKSWILTGNPVYPFLHRWLGGPEWSSELGARLAAWQRSLGMGREPLDYLLLPVRVILSGGEGYHRFDGALHPVWIVLLPLALLYARRDRTIRRALMVCGFFFVLWAASSQQMRFLVAILPLLAVAGARAVTLAIRRLAATRPRLDDALRAAALLAAAAALLLSARPWLGAAIDNAPALAHRYPEMREALIPPVDRFVAEQLPAGATILLLNRNRGFFLDRDYLADSFFEASQIAAAFAGDDAAAARERLRELGVTHVLIEQIERGLPYPESLLAALRDPRWSRPVHRSPDGASRVYELAPP
ncbi:MAG TPA: hypothetical protein VMV46_11545 [Thermoanaerobaculia bacterium]|nr:hypothetical protein [Thermoanaerobaculia bacterium]